MAKHMKTTNEQKSVTYASPSARTQLRVGSGAGVNPGLSAVVRDIEG